MYECAILNVEKEHLEINIINIIITFIVIITIFITIIIIIAISVIIVFLLIGTKTNICAHKCRYCGTC